MQMNLVILSQLLNLTVLHFPDNDNRSAFLKELLVRMKWTNTSKTHKIESTVFKSNRKVNGLMIVIIITSFYFRLQWIFF